MVEDVGRSPSGPGQSPSGSSQSTLSQAQPTVPNAGKALQLVPKAIFDAWGDLDLGEPEQAWACAVKRFREEARINRQCADQRKREARDADGQARLHLARAAEFESLARAMERAPITFPASGMSAGTAETNEDSAQGEARQRGGEAETPNPTRGDTHGE